jgi:hypothetical protein
MTVRQLIRELQRFDPEHVALIEGRAVRGVEADELDTPSGVPCPAVTIEGYGAPDPHGSAREFPSHDAGR